MLQTVLGSVKTFIVEPFGSAGNGFGLHQFDKSLEVPFRGGNVLRRDAAFVPHTLSTIGNPCLQKELT